MVRVEVVARSFVECRQCGFQTTLNGDKTFKDKAPLTCRPNGGYLHDIKQRGRVIFTRDPRVPAAPR